MGGPSLESSFGTTASAVVGSRAAATVSPATPTSLHCLAGPQTPVSLRWHTWKERETNFIADEHQDKVSAEKGKEG